MRAVGMIRKRIAVCVVALVCACACLFMVPACGSSDAGAFVGEWKIQNTQVTVVFSESKFKLVGNTFDYTVDDGKKAITYKSGDAVGTAVYSFSSDKKQLTLEESDANGGTKTTVFEKISNNGNAEPSAGVPATDTAGQGA